MGMRPRQTELEIGFNLTEEKQQDGSHCLCSTSYLDR